MRFARTLATQLARPRGAAGRWLGRAMDIVNRRPTQLAIDLLGARPGESIVDAGCGTGAALALLGRTAGLRLAGFDPSATMIDAARRRLPDVVRLAQATTSDRPFSGEQFDAVLALNLLYFCDDRGDMIADLVSMLKPGGRLVAYVTDGQSMATWGFTKVGLHRLWNADSLARAMVDAGFAPTSVCVHHHAITRSVNGLLVQATW